MRCAGPFRSALLTALLAALPLASAPAAGPPALPAPGAADPAAASASQQAAAAAFKGKKWEDALAAGKAAWAAGGGADALETIGVAALSLGHAALAYQCYDFIVADAGANPKTVGRARNQLKALAGQTGQVTVESKPEGAKIAIGGVYLGTTPLPPLHVLPGKIEVTAEFSGGTRQSKPATVTNGGDLTVQFDGPAPVAAAVVPIVAAVPIAVPVVPVPPPPTLPPPPKVAPPPPPAPVTDAPAPPEGASPAADAAALPVPGNPVMAGMHRLALKLGAGIHPDGPGGLRRVAVMPFEATTKEKRVEELGTLSSELLSSRMAAQPRILQVERSRLNSVVGELKRVEGGQVSSDGAVSVGKLLGANAVIVGSVGDAGADYLVTARAVDVETGRILVAGDESVPQSGMVALSEDMVEIKSPLNAALRSAAVPGWGQIYNGDTIRGVAYITGTAAFAGTAIVSAILGNSAKEDYQKNTADEVDRRQDGNDHYDRANLALIGLGVVWAASLLDAYFTGSDARIVTVPDAPPAGPSAGSGLRWSF